MFIRILKLAISLFYIVFYSLGVSLCRLIRIPSKGKFIVLGYHSVKDTQRIRFAKHLKFINRCGSAVSADFEGPIKKYKRYVSVTFDDGYQNFLKNVLPQIQEFRVPTAVFIPTGNLGKRPEWITDQKYDFVNERILTEEQLKRLPTDIVAIGSHSVSHPDLTSLSEEAALKELQDSKRRLEEIIQKEIILFSLPYGCFNQKILNLSKKAGYKRVFLHIPVWADSPIKDFLIGRIEISLNDWPIEYRLKILGAYQWLPVAFFLRKNLLKLSNKMRIYQKS